MLCGWGSNFGKKLTFSDLCRTLSWSAQTVHYTSCWPFFWKPLALKIIHCNPCCLLLLPLPTLCWEDRHASITVALKKYSLKILTNFVLLSGTVWAGSVVVTFVHLYIFWMLMVQNHLSNQEQKFSLNNSHSWARCNVSVVTPGNQTWTNVKNVCSPVTSVGNSSPVVWKNKTSLF